MAKVIGTAGAYAWTQSLAKYRRMMAMYLIGILAGGIFLGFDIAFLLPVRHVAGALQVAFLLVAVGVFFLSYGKLIGRTDAFEKQRENWRKGARGEALVGALLADLPGSFVVFNDVRFRFGNIDHLAIGPTGIFALEVKTCRGIVTSDAAGELLFNGKQEDSVVSKLTRAAMDLNQRIKALTSDEFFVHGLVVFSHARVEANWGTTRTVRCMRDEKLLEYITEFRPRRILSREDVNLIENVVTNAISLASRQAVAPTTRSSQTAVMTAA